MSYLNPDTNKVKTETEKQEMNFFALNRYVERMLWGTLWEKELWATLPKLDDSNSVHIWDLHVLPKWEVEFIPKPKSWEVC
jgi:hypothetical protein